MPIKKFKPTSPGQRFKSVADFAGLTRKRPEKSLTEANPQKAGRNNHGRITMRRRGGGHKRLLRVIDYRREKDGVPCNVTAIEYDPNRSARIALVVYKDGEKRYIIAPDGLEVGMTLMSGVAAEYQTGNSLPLDRIPLGSVVHNVEMTPGKGGKLARSAGNSCQFREDFLAFSQKIWWAPSGVALGRSDQGPQNAKEKPSNQQIHYSEAEALRASRSARREKRRLLPCHVRSKKDTSSMAI